MELRVSGLEVLYGNKIILKNIHMEAKEGEIVSLIGPNGSGKSTLVKTVSRLLRPQAGEISYSGRTINSIPTKELARLVAVLPQEKSLNVDLTVEQLVSYGRHPHLGFGKRFGKRDREIVMEAIRLTGMEEYREKSMHSLSGGERQRAWISMALAQQPRVLILDEPTTYLDISYQMEVLELVEELNKSLGITVLMVLHDLNHACRYSDKVYVLKKGTVHGHGAPGDVIDRTMLKEVFGIDARIYEDEVNNCRFFIPGRIAKEGA
ncbi:MAG: ABC transporter ATP-binding protein [Gudongella sp.]|nr:ABC transporter ATP-binding protein [Gudongella sp.]